MDIQTSKMRTVMVAVDFGELWINWYLCVGEVEFRLNMAFGVY